MKFIRHPDGSIDGDNSENVWLAICQLFDGIRVIWRDDTVTIRVRDGERLLKTREVFQRIKDAFGFEPEDIGFALHYFLWQGDPALAPDGATDICFTSKTPTNAEARSATHLEGVGNGAAA